MNTERNKVTMMQYLLLLEWHVNSYFVLLSSIMILWLNVPSSSWIDIVNGPFNKKN